MQDWKEDNDSNDVFTIFSNTLQYFLSLNIDTQKLLSEDVIVKDRRKQIEFMGIPFFIMGKKKFDCTHGVDRNRSLKKKRLDGKVEKVYIYLKRPYIYIYIYIYIYRYRYIYRYIYIYIYIDR